MLIGLCVSYIKQGILSLVLGSHFLSSVIMSQEGILCIFLTEAVRSKHSLLIFVIEQGIM